MTSKRRTPGNFKNAKNSKEIKYLWKVFKFSVHQKTVQGTAKVLSEAVKLQRPELESETDQIERESDKLKYVMSRYWLR